MKEKLLEIVGHVLDDVFKIKPKSDFVPREPEMVGWESDWFVGIDVPTEIEGQECSCTGLWDSTAPTKEIAEHIAAECKSELLRMIRERLELFA